ncbi:MAG: hypothetical protein HY454_02190 [Parcubacteria group bacterium]|nr:hypothetical protein [Parcubacteria group bacterium]
MQFGATLSLSLFLAATIPICAGCDNPVLPFSPFSPSSGALAGSEGETINPIAEAKEVANDVFGSASLSGESNIPQMINGIDLTTIPGWWANLYPWELFPEQSPVHPIPELFTPYQKQSVNQMIYQEQVLNTFGSGLDILQIDPSSNDLAHWRSAYFSYTRRPLFVSYEHVFNSNYIPSQGPKDMSNLVNRQAFMKDIRFLFDNVITPYQSRYATVDGRAVVYMWSTVQMKGDFASLLDEARQKYPVFFIGSGEDMGDIERVEALDGIMEYSLFGFSGSSGNYQMMASGYFSHFRAWRSVLDAIQRRTGKKIYLIPTFQAAYDDTLVIPPRGNRPLYPKSRAEVVEHARLISIGMTRWRVFDNMGPFVVCSEWPEGGAVCPSIRQPEKEGRYVGYGTDRIEIVARYFGRR